MAKLLVKTFEEEDHKAICKLHVHKLLCLSCLKLHGDQHNKGMMQRQCRKRSFCRGFAGFWWGFSEGNEDELCRNESYRVGSLSSAPRTPRSQGRQEIHSISRRLWLLGVLGTTRSSAGNECLKRYGKPVRLPMPNWLPARTGLPLAKSISSSFSLPTWPPCSSVSSPMIFLVAVSTMSPLEG